MEEVKCKICGNNITGEIDAITGEQRDLCPRCDILVDILTDALTSFILTGESFYRQKCIVFASELMKAKNQGKEKTGKTNEK